MLAHHEILDIDRTLTPHLKMACLALKTTIECYILYTLLKVLQCKDSRLCLA